MIRSALIALGLSAGAVDAQGMVPTAPVLESCGGTRLVLSAAGAPSEENLDRASDVVSARIGGLYGGVFDYTEVVDDQILVSLPAGMPVDRDGLSQLLEKIDFRFLQVVERVSLDKTVDAPDGFAVLPQMDDPILGYIVENDPVLDGTSVLSAQATFDQMGQPAVSFRFSEEGGKRFGEYTAEHIGEPFAIALRDEVITAPTIQSAIWGGSGIVTGSFANEEAERLAALMQGGVLPFDLDVLSEESVDGSDPSADFCP
ncbi:preprotein translocase subunit SecD [Octadecabacter ascidiaceicola]|uniref:Preprotein translocase subunit SecD n=1 Tax=Octadecabacter ascidiaceicola TaxID=1655543 RepID=A0A238JP80_9RHOB|nr:hypothetical protein [Octadecabacter ascidiaceicola]SMX32315.1 preprotein translocase subunit SecD [Octadecabacter ascidiaceicola]